MSPLALTAATGHENSIGENLLVILMGAGAVALVLPRVRMQRSQPYGMPAHG